MTTAARPTPSDPAYVAVLGTVRVVEGESTTDVTSARVRDLLLTLALARGRSVPSSHLVDTIWPGTTPQSPRAALHTVVARLRALSAAEVVVSGTHGYALGVPSDVDLVEAATREAQVLLDESRPEEALDRVCGARLLCGEPRSAGSELEEEVDALRSSMLLALDRVALDAHVALGAPAEAVVVAERLARLRPTDEPLHLTLMRCYDALGRTNDALRSFSRVREALADELGSTPGPELVGLNAALLRRTVPPTRTELPPAHPVSPGSTGSPVRTADRRPPQHGSVGLRTAASALIGRDEEIEGLLTLLGSARLVTVLGPGGLGKTRTAQEVARRTDAGGRRVMVVELASVRTDDDVALALATALDVREETGGRRIGDRLLAPGTSTRVAERLDERPTLLVLDNCEHVVEGAATWVAELLAEVEGLTVLTTSRSPLLVGGEHVVRLAPLATVASAPGTAAGPAVELFEARARAVRADVALPRDLVERLCDRLDGLPLAIELAAARVSTMTVAEVEQRLASRFELLTGGGRSAPARHRTLEAVIGWSWDLLGPDEQVLLRRASVFPSGFAASAAQTVAELRSVAHPATTDEVEVPVQTLDLLQGLVDQSLLTVHEDRASGTARFRMLETVREFGALRLEEVTETRATQDAFFVWAVEHSEHEWPLLTRPGQVAALARARSEQENLVHVLRLSTAAGRGDVVLAVFGMLGLFWTLSGAHSDVALAAPGVLAASAGTPVLPDRAGTAALALLVVLTTTFTTQEEIRQHALRRLHDVLTSGLPLPAVVRELGEVALEAVDLSSAGAVLARARGSEDGFVRVVACVVSAQLAENGGDLALAQEHALAGYTIAAERGDTWGTASAAMLLGQLSSEQARPEEALSWLGHAREGLVLLEATADLGQVAWLEASNLVALGRVAEAEKLLAGFDAAYADPSRVSTPQDAVEARAVGLSGRAEIAYVSGDHAGALRLYETARSLMRGTRSGRSPWFLVFGASVLCVSVLGGDHEHARRTASNLRARTLALRRLSPRFTDFPILGTASLALGVHLVHEPALGRTEDGLLLLAAAERLGSRQDVPSLLRSTYEEDARRAHGDDALAAAQEAVRSFPQGELADRVLDVLRRGPWES